MLGDTQKSLQSIRLEPYHSGRTTRLAFMYIVEAMENPNRWVAVRDHWDTFSAHSELLKTIQRILHNSDLHSQWTFRKDPGSIIFRKAHIQ